MPEPQKLDLQPIRNLHWVFKIGNRKANLEFFQDVLGMTVLRHEEFKDGCAASCNGPYDGMWSKTMIGYGPEDTHFVLELTYNYGVESYSPSSDLGYIQVSSPQLHARLLQRGYGAGAVDEALRVKSPDGYTFVIQPQEVPGSCPVTELALNTQDLNKALAYWSGFLGFSIEGEQSGGEGTLLRCAPGQCGLRLMQLPADEDFHRGSSFGRVAFSCPGRRLPALEAASRADGHSVLTPYVSLDTPGKAPVQVVILADPDGHEICFVGDEGFRELSQPDPRAKQLLASAMAADQSGSWQAAWRAPKAAAAAAEKLDSAA